MAANVIPERVQDVVVPRPSVDYNLAGFWFAVATFFALLLAHWYINVGACTQAIATLEEYTIILQAKIRSGTSLRGYIDRVDGRGWTLQELDKETKKIIKSLREIRDLPRLSRSILWLTNGTLLSRRTRDAYDAVGLKIESLTNPDTTQTILNAIEAIERRITRQEDHAAGLEQQVLHSIQRQIERLSIALGTVEERAVSLADSTGATAGSTQSHTSASRTLVNSDQPTHLSIIEEVHEGSSQDAVDFANIAMNQELEDGETVYDVPDNHSATSANTLHRNRKLPGDDANSGITSDHPARINDETSHRKLLGET
ncbi:Hypothetical protein D9617_14g075940 [Elsinoe fawcettii]|nr:Hypothetical protein D9617_14g075940 [Elsinoe fawcettii]